MLIIFGAELNQNLKNYKMTIAEKTSVTMLPLFMPMFGGYSYFIYTILNWMWKFQPGLEVCWEAGILGTVSYGLFAIWNFLQNAHSEKINLTIQK